MSEANPARKVPVGRYSAGTPNNPIQTQVRRSNRIAAAIICLKLPPHLRGRAGVGGLSCNIAGFHRFKTPVSDCRISKSDLQFYNGCKMLKQVQHDKFYCKPASPLEEQSEPTRNELCEPASVTK